VIGVAKTYLGPLSKRFLEGSLTLSLLLYLKFGQKILNRIVYGILYDSITFSGSLLPQALII